MTEISQIVVIGGPPAAGKSTVAEIICARGERTVHLTVDDVQGWIRAGFIPPYDPASFPQTLTIARAASRAAATFARDGYAVCMEGVIGPDVLTAMVEELRDANAAIHHAMLLPSGDALVARAHGRQQVNAGVSDEMYRQVQAMFAGWDMAGVVIDSTSLSAKQTTDAIVAACASGEALVWSP